MKVKTTLQRIVLVSFLLVVFFASGPATGSDKLIDLNMAPSEELQTLPGVGPVLAQRIITDREANGPFQSPGDITRVFGFGEKRFQSIRTMVTVSHLDGGLPAGARSKRLISIPLPRWNLRNYPGSDHPKPGGLLSTGSSRVDFSGMMN